MRRADRKVVRVEADRNGRGALGPPGIPATGNRRTTTRIAAKRTRTDRHRPGPDGTEGMLVARAPTEHPTDHKGQKHKGV